MIFPNLINNCQRVEFWATVVHNYSTFWTGIKSEPYQVDTLGGNMVKFTIRLGYCDEKENVFVQFRQVLKGNLYSRWLSVTATIEQCNNLAQS